MAVLIALDPSVSFKVSDMKSFSVLEEYSI